MLDILPVENAENITGLALDSRKVKPGYLFAALRGSKSCGMEFVNSAIEAGAVALLVDEDAVLPETVPDYIHIIRAANPRAEFAQLCGAFYKQPEIITAITGTNGKTSTASFVRQLWQVLGVKASSIGTLGVEGDYVANGSMTTPDTASLHALLDDMKCAGVEHVAMEASSHGLHQYRLDGVKISAAGFTNLTHDHLDYHGNLEDYFAAKARLFTEILKPDGVAVINVDDEYGQKLLALCAAQKLKTLSYGENAADIKISRLSAGAASQSVSVHYNGGDYTVHLNLAGDYQVMNAVLAAGLVLATGAFAPQLVFSALEKLHNARGRLELAGHAASGAPIYVDYAHTPDALERALATLRQDKVNHIHVVFGCGGDRDAAKRPVMGGIAARLADFVVVTDDNPRTENAAAIRAEVLSGTGGKAIEIGDRREAISVAIQALKSGDVLLIAGKGHELGQIIGSTTYPFDDVAVVQEILQQQKAS